MQLLIVGNWKMAPEKLTEAQKLAKATLSIAKKHKKNTFVVCPPFVHIQAVSKISSLLNIGAQTVTDSPEIAQTGLVSAGMIKSYGVKYCIVGHSEIRSRGETNESVKESILRLLEKKIIPIVCVGERERDTQGWYLSEVKEQLESFLSVVPKTSLKNIVVAYEPVWAIGAKAPRVATPMECQEMIIYIRKIISDMHGAKVGDVTRIIYGGSVDEKNAKAFVVEGGAQGFLIGRVSLDVRKVGILANSLE